MRFTGTLIAALAMSSLTFAGGHAKAVGITSSLMEQEVMHQGQPVVIKRNQNGENTIVPAYALTSRPCPPFCIQPMDLAPGVETIGELELLSMMEKNQLWRARWPLTRFKNARLGRERHDSGGDQPSMDHALCQKVRHVHNF
jgi:hypothetical protein